MKKIFTFLVAFLAIAGNAVWGQEADTGDFTVTQGSDYSFESSDSEGGILTITGDVTVSNTNQMATNNRIVIDGGTETSPIDVTFNGINIKVEKDYRWPVMIKSGSYVNLILENENTIESPKFSNGTAATRGILWLEGDEDTGAFSSLTIKGEGKLKVIVNSDINAIGGINALINIESGIIEATKGGIGGQNSTVNISGGEITMNTESSSWGCIGGGNVSTVIISDDAKIYLKNPKNGIYANKIEISGGTLDITYESDYAENNAGNGIVCRGCDDPDTQGIFSITGGTYTITDNRKTKKATGISTNSAGASQPVIVKLSSCSVKMDVRGGISGGREDILNIKSNAIVDILATQTPIDMAKIDISTKSLVTVKSTGSLRHGIQYGMTTGENGNAYVVSDTDLGIDEDNRKDWKGIVLEGNKEDDFVSGYVYGNITLDRDFELKENYHLVYCEPFTLTITDNQLINNGGVFIEYEKQEERIENKITEGTGCFSYQIFFDEKSLDIPNSLKDKLGDDKSIGDVIVSIGDGKDVLGNDTKVITNDILHKKTRPLNKEVSDMVFGKSKTNITLGLDNKELNNSSYPKVAENYIIKSFDVKTKKDGRVIATGVTSFFDMPAEAVVICNLKIEGAYKLSYELADELEGKTVDVIFKDQKQNVIESAANEDLVYIFISAPGYDTFNISSVTAEYTETEKNAGDVYDVKGAPDGYVVKVFPKMVKGDVTFVISGKAGTQIPFKVSIDENIQNGEVKASTENGTDATAETTTIYYKDKIVVKATPKDGYELNSLQYKIDGEETVVDITDYDQESGTYSFSMPAADVTITAVFSEIKYTVSVSEDIVNGTVIVMDENENQVNEFVPGSKVVLNPKPEEGFVLGELSYTYMEDGEEKTASISGVSFPMPESDVTIHATFVLDPTIDDDEESSGIAQKRYRLYLADQDFYLNDEYDEAGLVLYSRHDKKYTDVGGSFTVWFEKNGEVNEGARVFISNRANGEYKEVKLDEVSGYYQIRNVQSNIYVKLYTEEGFPVANESIEATEARAYAQPNKIVVITPEPTDVQIISMAGAVVATAQVAGQQEFANLAEGVYIVRMGNEIIKLQVRN